MRQYYIKAIYDKKIGQDILLCGEHFQDNVIIAFKNENELPKYITEIDTDKLVSLEVRMERE